MGFLVALILCVPLSIAAGAVFGAADGQFAIWAVQWPWAQPTISAALAATVATTVIAVFGGVSPTKILSTMKQPALYLCVTAISAPLLIAVLGTPLVSDGAADPVQAMLPIICVFGAVGSAIVLAAIPVWLAIEDIRSKRSA
jgi:hypothetical protein